jgi:hypothetical protein
VPIRGIQDGRRLTDQTIIPDREWLARYHAVRWTEISDGAAVPSAPAPPRFVLRNAQGFASMLAEPCA